MSIRHLSEANCTKGCDVLPGVIRRHAAYFPRFWFVVSLRS
jgi:hypothetical protein